MVTGEPILEARGLEFTYPGPVPALCGLDLALGERELLCVIGPNGSGKSTLLRCLAGLERPDSGQVLLGGRDLFELGVRERAQAMAVVPQFLPALPDVRVDRFVLGGRYAWRHGLRGGAAHDEEAVRRALEEADVADVATRDMASLSGGQRQRVLVARALAQEACILLVDEPTNALDPEHQIRVFLLIEGLIARGRSVVVVTHDLNLAAQFATRVALLDRGRVVAQGAIGEVLRREVLEPVYGRHLHFGEVRGADGRARPLVLPWREEP